MKLAIAALLLCAIVVSTQAQYGLSFGPPRPFVGFPPSQFFQTVVLQSEAQKLLSTPGFPDDLQQRVVTTMSDADVGFNECNTVVNTMPWLQIRCITMQLQKSKAELKAIDDEAQVRIAASAAAGSATGTPIGTA